MRLKKGGTKMLKLYEMGYELGEKGELIGEFKNYQEIDKYVSCHGGSYIISIE